MHLYISLSIFVVANPILITSRVAHAYLCFSCVYAYRNCLQNARFSLLYAIDAKYPFDITFPNLFRNIERPKNYRHKDFIYSLIFSFFFFFFFFFLVLLFVCLFFVVVFFFFVFFFFFFCFVFFFVVFLVVVWWGTARKDYFTHFEPSHR